MFLDDMQADREEIAHLPWATPPSNLGSTECRWCWRFIYAPASPCSVKVLPALAEMPTTPGLGERCKWELATRVPAA